MRWVTIPDAIGLLCITSEVQGFCSRIRGNWWRQVKSSSVKAKPVVTLSMSVLVGITLEALLASWQATTK